MATGTTFPATPGIPLPTNTVVANFVDTNLNAINQTITAVINWGDGKSSPGTVKATGSPGSYSVVATHTYATTSITDSFAMVVTIADPSGQTATASSTALLATPI